MHDNENLLGHILSLPAKEEIHVLNDCPSSCIQTFIEICSSFYLSLEFFINLSMCHLLQYRWLIYIGYH